MKPVISLVIEQQASYGKHSLSAQQSKKAQQLKEESRMRN